MDKNYIAQCCGSFITMLVFLALFLYFFFSAGKGISEVDDHKDYEHILSWVFFVFTIGMCFASCVFHFSRDKTA